MTCVTVLSFKKHYKLKHQAREEYVCTVCGKAFSDKQRLQEHVTECIGNNSIFALSGRGARQLIRGVAVPIFPPSILFDENCPTSGSPNIVWTSKNPLFHSLSTYKQDKFGKKYKIL